MAICSTAAVSFLFYNLFWLISSSLTPSQQPFTKSARFEMRIQPSQLNNGEPTPSEASINTSMMAPMGLQETGPHLTASPFFGAQEDFT